MEKYIGTLPKNVKRFPALQRNGKSREHQKLLGKG